jgi:uncharacterized protein YndB with AHSA1/START domain
VGTFDLTETATKEGLMPRAEGEVTIRRPASEVFAFLSDGANNKLWRPDVVEVECVTSGPVGVGTVFRQVHGGGPLGRTLRADYEITDFQPDTRLAFRVVAGPARPVGSYRLNEAGGSTTVHFELHWEPTGMKRVLAGPVAKQMPREIANLERMKAVLEAREPA